MIAITAATGHLGRLVIEHLLKLAPARDLVAIVRTPSKAEDLARRGIQVRQADYNDRESLGRAFAGVDRVVFISSSEVGQRVAQHRNVIDAAREQAVQLLAYTSLLRSDTSPLSLAPEHLETEHLIQASGVPHILLRNGWYAENYTASLPGALEHGALFGSAGEGRLSLALRTDYAEAAARAVTGGAEVGRTYELAGDEAWTLSELAAEVSRQSGKSISYRNLPEAEYERVLQQAGLPGGFAAMLSSWDACAARGALFEEGRQLSRLIGHPTTPLAEAVRQALVR